MDSPTAPRGIEPWITLSREKMLDCVIFSVHRVRRRSPDGEKDRDFYALESRDWVNIVAVTPDDRVVLVRQYRQGTDEISLEVPGGIVDEGEDPEATALRELEEETGYHGARAEMLGRVRANPAFLDNSLDIVAVLGAEPLGSTSFDDSEDLELVLEPVEAIDRLITSGAITHSYSVLALLMYQRWRNG
ncbi:MAG TPA: NUDIX hydrolase [Candidatus Kapabacteria bacterium]|jgi:8-oxo-dGTP pyrophosphatase MutT (NUDIX family)|nr:NUDIX hydrolase [Candidatus Kapabacteria bacterium]